VPIIVTNNGFTSEKKKRKTENNKMSLILEVEKNMICWRFEAENHWSRRDQKRSGWLFRRWSVTSCGEEQT